ncbi:MAG TPA: UDP-N-acetylmuramoyl-L-alanyl-D-glutamate--2,6-diaminopimelate ligase [Stellaceae bacterium]|nr:UDP-N-acetylmuramoyl-L-alanyl-D-glutamate--2,6-diaminopimelate ligase [Stellaceae bacterium]
MRLTELMGGNRALVLPASDSDPEISGLVSDSRAVEPGFLFAALAGTRTDGSRFVGEAVDRGAVAVLVADAAPFAALTTRRPPVQVIEDANPRRRLALMAARFHAPQPRTVVAVTGTNGKTSVADFTRQIWQRHGLPAASLGTLGIVGPDFTQPGSLTTPDPVALHRALQALAGSGIDHVALEASSHGLDQYRLDGLALAAAAFTNLTRDHLDYHAGMAEYFAAKSRLFAELLPQDGVAVLNLDAAEGRQLAALCRDRGQRVIGIGTAASADLRLVAARPTATGQAITVAALGAMRELELPLLGGFQASNALAALGLAVATGTPVDTALAALAGLAGVPGRMEHVASAGSGAPVIVDYAHTPDALQTALRALRPHCRGRLVVVFGGGGDRDPGKRPMMGAVAERDADIAIVTDDNPRSEDRAAIRRAILAACPKAREIADRGAAIVTAVALLEPGDALLIAGKGHETGQIIGREVLPFSDRAAARAAIEAQR